MITVITGGIKSGKSDFALQLVKKSKNGAFIATSDPNDDSMKMKIQNHRMERINLSIKTYEEKLNIAELMPEIQSKHDIIVIDCLTMWVSNLLFLVPDTTEQKKIKAAFLKILKNIAVPCIIITNEVGLGIIPENKIARIYGEELGMLNREIAAIAENVVLMVSGLPVKIK